MILNLILLRIVDSVEHSDRIFELYSIKIPSLVQETELLIQQIKKIGYSTSFECFQCLSFLYKSLKLWRFQTIRFKGNEINTSKQAEEFISEYTHKLEVSSLR